MKQICIKGLKKLYRIKKNSPHTIIYISVVDLPKEVVISNENKIIYKYVKWNKNNNKKKET